VRDKTYQIVECNQGQGMPLNSGSQWLITTKWQPRGQKQNSKSIFKSLERIACLKCKTDRALESVTRDTMIEHQLSHEKFSGYDL
jgi:hypothetical protein